MLYVIFIMLLNITARYISLNIRARYVSSISYFEPGEVKNLMLLVHMEKSQSICNVNQ